MRTLLILLFSFGLYVITSAQIIDDIKKSSDENRENESTPDSDNADNMQSSPPNAEACASACGCLFNNMDLIVPAITFIFDGFHKADSSIESRADTIPRVFSCNISFDAGLAKTKNSVFSPRLLLNGALFATDFRFYSINEKGINNSTSNFSTVDWQILMLNLAVNRQANLRIGSGIMVENYSSTTFNEHTAMLDIYPSNIFKFSVEGRLAPDYESGALVRQELNLSFFYTFKQVGKTNINIYLKYSRSSYYEKVNFGAVSFGLEFNIN